MQFNVNPAYYALATALLSLSSASTISSPKHNGTIRRSSNGRRVGRLGSATQPNNGGSAADAAVDVDDSASNDSDGDSGSSISTASDANCVKSMNVQLYYDSPTIAFNPDVTACKSGRTYVGNGSGEDGSMHITLVPARTTNTAIIHNGDGSNYYDYDDGGGDGGATLFHASITEDSTGVVYSIAPDGYGEMMVTERWQEDYREELDSKKEDKDGETTPVEQRALAIESSQNFHNSAEGIHDKEVDADELTNINLDSNHRSTKILDEETSSTTIIDVMVLWTAHAECQNSMLPRGCTRNPITESNILGLINLAIEETNAAYSLSGVLVELNLVHAYYTDYTESSSGDAFVEALSYLRKQGDGIMDDAHEKRKDYGADVVGLIIDDDAYCGIANGGPRLDYMFSVTSWSCATGYYSFGHEIGHNLGCNHDKGTENDCSRSSYNYGYRDPSGEFRSILAYSCKSGQCDKNPGGGCTRVQRFSNPNFLYEGKPIGSAEVNNARQINDVRVEVAAYFDRPETGVPTFSVETSPPTITTTTAPTTSPQTTSTPITSPPTTSLSTTSTPTTSPSTPSPSTTPSPSMAPSTTSLPSITSSPSIELTGKPSATATSIPGSLVGTRPKAKKTKKAKRGAKTLRIPNDGEIKSGGGGSIKRIREHISDVTSSRLPDSPPSTSDEQRS